MFKWIRHLQRRSDGRRELVRVVAERSAAELFAQLDAWPEMDVAELRGYVRARAAATVRRQVRLAVAELRSNHTLPADVVALALERTIHLVVRDRLLRSQLPVVRRAAA